MTFPIEAIVFLFLLVTALVILRLKDLFAAAMLGGVFSLVCACVYTLMDAVDVAITEAAVGAGISTVLILGALSLTTDREDQQPLRFWPIAIVVLTGAVLLYGTLDMPHYGDPAAVIHHHIAPRYIEGSGPEFDIPNIVTNLLAGYRGYDTMGETSVVLTATIGVILLLAAGRRKDPPEPVRSQARRPTMTHHAVHVTMNDYVILRVAASTLVPFILLFALYVQFHGDFGPGGGFQAGVLFGAGIILFGIIHGLHPMQRVVPPTVVEIGLMVGVLLYSGTGVASLLAGGDFLDYAALSASPVHGRHIGIMLVEGGVGICVASAMIWIFYCFAGRRHARGDAPEERQP